MGKNSKNMYKTIRHGENSLQYTILPQNDDFRLEGKIKSVESTRKPFVKCNQNMKSLSASRQKRRSCLAYLGVIFICTVIVGAILIPFLISADCMPNPNLWFLRTKAAWSGNDADHAVMMASNGDDGSATNGNNTKSFENSKSQPYITEATLALNKGNLMQAHNDMSVGKMVKIIHQNGIEKIIFKVNKPKITYPDFKKESLGRENRTQNLDSNYNVMAEPQLTITVQALNVNKNNENNLMEQPQDIYVTHNTNIELTTTTIITPYINRLEEIDTKNEDMDLYVLPKATAASQKSILTAITLLATKNATTANQNINRINQVPLLKGSGGGSGSNSITSIAGGPKTDIASNTKKKPALPPVLVKNYSKLLYTTPNKQSTKNLIVNNAALQNTTTNCHHNKIISNTLKDNSKQNQTNIEWIQNHWPYIDPSTYFQWNNFKAEDSVLLPALLGFALIGIILVVTICLVARNKRFIVNRMRQRNRNNMTENGDEDNATLLTGVTVSDDDE